MQIGRYTKLALILSTLGIIVTAYLTITHYTNVQVACPNTGVINCEKVLTSPYSNLLGVPLGIWGLAFFLIETGVLLWGNKDARVIYNGLGLAFVLYFFWIEYTVGAICIYCTTVHALVILLLALSIYGYGKERHS